MPDQAKVVTETEAGSPTVTRKRKRNRRKPKAAKNADESIVEVESANYASVERKLPSQNWEAFLKTQKPKAIRRKPLETRSTTAEITDVVALDCEMVGAGEKGKDNLLARVSLVNQLGQVLYDSFVKPLNDVEITDYRTKYSGVRPGNLKNAAEFRDAQRAVSSLIEGRIVVGHDLKNDFKVLYLGHPRKKIRDTSKYKAFQELATGHGKAKPSLKVLADKILDMKIQHGEHDSVMDAKAAMALYNLHQREWEASLNKNRTKKKKDSSANVPIKRGSSRALLAEAMAGELSTPPVSKKPQVKSTKSNQLQEKSSEIPVNTNPRIGAKRKRIPSKVRKNSKKSKVI